jgi:hypothetical protein
VAFSCRLDFEEKQADFTALHLLFSYLFTINTYDFITHIKIYFHFGGKERKTGNITYWYLEKYKKTMGRHRVLQ